MQRFGLGGNVRGQLAFEERNLIFEQQLAFFEAAQLQLIVNRRGHQGIDRQIQIAMLFAELDDPAFNGLAGVVGGSGHFMSGFFVD